MGLPPPPPPRRGGGRVGPEAGQVCTGTRAGASLVWQTEAPVGWDGFRCGCCRPDTYVFTDGPAACGGLCGVQVWWQACWGLPHSHPHTRKTGPRLDLLGARVWSAWLWLSPGLRDDFSSQFSQGQNHFLSKHHNGTQRGDQKTCVSFYVLAEGDTLCLHLQQGKMELE